MNSAIYLLLRNNKESGPFSLQQLKEMGLKPYDLIWVQGRSAAWRYPGEVNELKPFAPIVEEQPFDRFYKKPEANKEKHFHEIIEEAERIKANKINVPADTSIYKKQNIAEHVFVSLPEQPGIPSSSFEINKTSNEKEIKQIKDTHQTEIPSLDSQKTESALNSFKDQYAKTIQTRKQKIDYKRNTKGIIEFSLAALFLLILGTLIFLNFRPGHTKPIVNSIPKKNNLIEKSPILLSPEKSNEAITKSDEPIESVTDLPIESKESHPAEKKNRSNDLKASVKNKESGADDIKTVSSHPESDGQRQKSVRVTDAPIFEKRTDIASQVSVIANEYKRRSFGGIENLRLTVVNSSNFILDKVIVELQYLKPSELPLKTEKIEFISIAPNASKTLKIPDSPRGIKVLCKIIQVESEQYDKNTAGL